MLLTLAAVLLAAAQAAALQNSFTSLAWQAVQTLQDNWFGAASLRGRNRKSNRN